MGYIPDLVDRGSLRFIYGYSRLAKLRTSNNNSILDVFMRSLHMFGVRSHLQGTPGHHSIIGRNTIERASLPPYSRSRKTFNVALVTMGESFRSFRKHIITYTCTP
ncbi:hypothetical protein FRB95_006176 [Tulasnella sp. JGI-2019a]|nr:hypothetical protein FRB95_006176 [Tulasnella sp. JGI-2019a]